MRDDFGDPEAELQAAFTCCALVDRSDLARLVAGGPDFLDLLNRLSTAEVAGLAPGQGTPTVLTTNKGRIIERLFVHHLGDAGVLLVGGAGSETAVLEHFTRFTFAEQTGLGRATEGTRQLALIGPRGAAVLERCGLPRPGPHQTATGESDGATVHVLGQDGLSGDGRSVVTDVEHAETLWQRLSAAVVEVGGRPAGARATEAYRVLRGLPASGHELTGDYNPLEAGLREAISFDKGCYVGQEVVARLRTYDKVSRAIVGLEFLDDRAPQAGARLLDEGRTVGTVTSAMLPPGRRRPVGLGYVKNRDRRDDQLLDVEDGGPAGRARVVELPFAPPGS